MHEGIPLKISIEIFGDNWSATLGPHSVIKLTIMIVMFNFFLHSMTVTEFKKKIKERTDKKSRIMIMPQEIQMTISRKCEAIKFVTSLSIMLMLPF